MAVRERIYSETLAPEAFSGRRIAVCEAISREEDAQALGRPQAAPHRSIYASRGGQAEVGSLSGEVAALPIREMLAVAILALATY